MMWLGKVFAFHVHTLGAAQRSGRQGSGAAYARPVCGLKHEVSSGRLRRRPWTRSCRSTTLSRTTAGAPVTTVVSSLRSHALRVRGHRPGPNGSGLLQLSLTPGPLLVAEAR
jgi:hypothetical protein